ncbi:uncharacterized protein LOC122014674 [Zingiber officinale]|uniref:SANT domain-containing protein n=1 Tax=Zingiber officinale TaxID=94328 RepID=A0A8J5KIS4_ZINOF|nr:uncharacterized protein LOC122014674 [Zingiber officinale]XP_042426959.1 uncharacterized protein LOC122014674 [Zingiber officinale]KAG6481232.1 hypothetical protein ZIOFF_057828 [Zingiber officinale]
MDSCETNCVEEEHIADMFSDQLPSSDSLVRNGIYDEPLISPRIGDGYQVGIPNLAIESQSCLTSINSIGAIDYHARVDLAIPIMWVLHMDDAIKDEQEGVSCSSISAIEGGSVKHSSTGKVEDECVDYTITVVPTENSSCHSVNLLACKEEHTDFGIHMEEPDGSRIKGSTMSDNKAHNDVPLLQPSVNISYSPLPGTISSSWSYNETQSFLLSLYIFGKNLVQVKKFIDCKEMGDILSYYYGKFYRSDAYRRWSACRKLKSRRCILGHRIFTGWRQQEFLSRVLPKVPKDAHDALLEAISIFNEGRISLKEFVCTLKTTVGMQVLVETIGIGTGKHDLTGIILDSVRSNQILSVRPEIPVGKACSSLSSGDIIKFLTGDFRLSKAKSNDIFWEAVWPRLLARGWHSEQPKDILTAKHSLVFLIPGIKKFSRKRLVKGNHYFDSVADVLNKVASDPRLLELETEGGTGTSITQDEIDCSINTKSDCNGHLDHKNHSYLCPKVPTSNSEYMKFTIVDTSLTLGEEPFKLRELRTLPVDAANNYDPLANIGEIASDSSEDSDDSSLDGQGNSDPNSSDNKMAKLKCKGISRQALHSDPSESEITFTSTTVPHNEHVSSDKCVEQINEKLPVKNSKSESSRRAKSGQHSYLAPMAKRRRLIACKYERAGRRSYSISKNHAIEEGVQLKMSSQDLDDDMVAVPNSCCGEVYPNFSNNISPDEMDNCSSREECRGSAASFDGMLQSRSLIDLNALPNVSQEYETGVPSKSEIGGTEQELTMEGVRESSETRQQQDSFGSMENFAGAAVDQQISTTSRRQSTRSRPPTTKALEALACGFIGTKPRGRDTRTLVSGNLTNRSRHLKSVEMMLSAPANFNADSTSTLSEPCSQPDDIVTEELFGVP